MKTDLVLNYYDSPVQLHNWLYRLVHFSDLHKFSKFIQIIISDSGTPLEKVSQTIEIAKKVLSNSNLRCVYLRSETEDLRKIAFQEHPDFAIRMQTYAYNTAILDFSSSDLIITSNVGNIVSPDYFNGHLAAHLLHRKAVVLPKRYDLFSDTYHTTDFKKSWEDIKKGDVRSSGGWPDMSVRREWLVEVGGWDNWYKFISPLDMDLGSRLTGKLDNGMPSEALFPQFLKGHYDNLGLTFIQPCLDNFISLTCNTYQGHTSQEERKASNDYGEKYYLENWGKIKRNINRAKIKFTEEKICGF